METVRRFSSSTWRTAAESMIELSGLTKKYGSFTAVDAIDLTVGRGELLGLLGPNGAGKTTTLRMIAGILRPTAGRVRIGGVDVWEDPVAAKMKLGFIPDRPFIYEKLTGAEFLRFVAGLFGQDRPVIEHRSRGLMAPFALEEGRDEAAGNYKPRIAHKLVIPN